MANPYFNASYYLANNLDVLAAGYTVETAEQHYLNYGAAEALAGTNAARKPAPWFDIQYYLTSNPDLLDAGIGADTAFWHFTTYGQFEQRSPADGLTVTDAKLKAYADANEDLREAFGITDTANLTEAQEKALTSHFYQYGYSEDRPGSPFESDDNPGQTFTLTAGVDNRTGTSGDDIFDGSVNAAGNATFQAFDVLNGGGGTDKLIAQNINSLSTTASTLQSIEQLEFYNTVANANINLTATTGVESILLSSSAGNATVSGINAGIETLAVTGNPTAGAADTSTFTVQNAAVSGAEDSVQLVVNGVGDTGANDNIVIQPTSGANGFETINVVAEGTGSFVTLNDGAATSLSTVNIDADVALTVSLTPNTVRTVDASESSAAVNVTVASGNVAVTGGAGNDTINVAGVYSNTQTKVDGGAGRDTLRLNSAEAAQATSQTARITNIETLTINNQLANNINLANWGATGVVLTTANSNGTITYTEGTGTLDLGTTDQTTASATISATGSLTGTADILNVTLGNATTANTNGGTIAATNIETINVTALGGAGGAQGISMAPLAGTTVNFLGSFGGSYGTVTASTIKADALTLTGATAAGVTLTAGSASSITGSGGIDNITGSAAADVINGGAGNDIIIGGGGNDVINGGAGADVIGLVAAAGSVAVGTAATVVTSAADSFIGTGLSLTNADTIRIDDVAAAGTYTITINTGVAATSIASAATVNLGTTTVTANGFLIGAGATTGLTADAVLYQDTNGNGIIEAGEFAVNLDYDAAGGDTFAITIVGGAAVVTATFVA